MSTLFQQMSTTAAPALSGAAAAVGNPRGFFIGSLVLILLICAVALWYYWPRSNDSTVLGPFVLTTKANKASTVAVFTQSQVDKSLGNNFSLGFFVYMDKINDSRIPFAGSKGDYRFKPFVNILGVGSIFIDPVHQEARFSVNTASPEFGKKADLTIESFAIARWNQVVITVEGRTVDLYMNGVLRTSALLENVPTWTPVGVLLETSPDFSGQAGMFQAWPRRLTESAVMKNYKRQTDTRGKPAIPDIDPNMSDVWNHFKLNLCRFGLCLDKKPTKPTEYVDYEYA